MAPAGSIKPLVVAIVRTGTLYRFEYVTRMRNMLARHMRLDYELVCLTDQAEHCSDVTFIDVRELGLRGWWAKMALFEPSWRGRSKIIYIDLDSVIFGDVTPLADVPGEFSILESPVRRLVGNKQYACAYNSSVMVIGGGQCSFVWQRFESSRDRMIEEYARLGDQAAIEALYPGAPFLQDLLPDFFVNYRHLTMIKPPGAIINFGGTHKPANCPIPWVLREWT